MIYICRPAPLLFLGWESSHLPMRYTMLITLLLLGLPFAGLGQAYHNSISFSFVAEASLGKYKSRPYRWSVSMRYEPADTTTKLKIWAVQWGRQAGDFKKTDRFAQRILPNEWRTYTIQGTLAPQADLIYLYSGLEGNGRFFFDNLSLQVQAPDQTWQQVPLKNGDFERSPTPLAGYLIDPELKGKLPIGVVADLVTGQGMNQSQALRFTLVGSTLVKEPLPYGRNKAAGKYCQLNGVKLYYETYGTGEPLLLLHGNGESIHSFSKQIEDLAQHYQVIAVDTRAQGKSVDTLTTRLTYELFADDMKALLDSLRLPKANILGWSDGGNTGLLMALRYPTYVHKLVTMGANLYPATETVDGKMLRQSEQTRKLLDKKGDLQNKRLLTLVLTEPHMSYAEIEAIRAPTLVLAGEKDIIKEAHSKNIGAHIPDARVIILKGLTHYAPQENPALFNQTVLDFLAAK